MKYLGIIKSEIQTLLKSDMLGYAIFPIWFWVYAILTGSCTYMAVDVIFKWLREGFTYFVCVDIFVCLVDIIISYLISPLRVFLQYDNKKEDCNDRKKIKKFYVFMGQILVIFIWLLIFLVFCAAMHIANTGTV